MTLELRGLCCDHPRCTRPMAAAGAAYRAVRPDVTVRWDARPLAMFNDQPAWEVEGGYDLIFVDHPMTGAAAERGALVPLDTILGGETTARIEAASVGPTQRSYVWAGHHWALGVDAATQVAAVRTDRLAALGAATPRTWDDVLTLAARAPGAVALPLYPSDALCSLVSLSANAALAAGDHPEWLRPEGAEMLAELAGLVDPACFDANPPALLEAMASGKGSGGIAYVPLVFGYASLARPPLSFTGVPGVDGRPRGAVLGGAGLAVIPASANVSEAGAFAAWCMDPEVQRNVLLPAGGQPGGRTVWDDPGAQGPAAGFFAATRDSVEQAFVRPRDPWWPDFQRQAGVRLAALLRERAPAGRIVGELSELADRHRETDTVEAGR